MKKLQAQSPVTCSRKRALSLPGGFGGKLRGGMADISLLVDTVLRAILAIE
jgi:hypothetical protein